MKILSRLLLTIIMVAGLCHPISALAKLDFDFSGFGTLGYAISDNSETEYLVGRSLDGADDSGTFKLDTKLGVQFDTSLDDRTSATLQVTSSQNYDGEFTPEVEWAFLKSQMSDSISLRFGRMGVPFFMVSDFRKVGYANTVLRPPEDTYFLAPLDSFDGLDLTGDFEWGETEVSAQTIFAYRDIDGTGETKVSLRDGYGGNIAFERGIARLQLSYIQTRLGIDSPEFKPLADGLAQAAVVFPVLAEAAEDFNGKLKKSTFFGVGLELDLDPFWLAAEYTQRRFTKSFLSSQNAWYVTGAYRWKNFTPYITLSQVTQTSKTEVEVPDLPILEPLAGPLNDNYASSDQNSAIVGMRWDFMPGAALKIQAENISRKVQGASFTRGNELQRGKGDDVKLFSLTLDFTF